LYDLANIEVLEGPQGTLYGRNSNGGTINILTNPAVLGRTTAGAEVEVGDYDLLRTSAYANLPLTDTLAPRFKRNPTAATCRAGSMTRTNKAAGYR